MVQAVKIVDVRRSFVPINSEAYTENYHATDGEDAPEDRIPVIPYMGENFLPTDYGMKSFFGTNSKLSFDTLSGQPDHVFLFQTLAYKNVVIALCDTGIWAKLASTTGAWTQLVVMAAPAADAFYEWFFVTIRNKLYVYRNNSADFYEIETDILDVLQISCTAKTPTFITGTAQLGMFRLGSRIGFWDANNAVAYSSADDLTDFTPNVLTGANVTTFNSVVGKISAIRSHGKQAIIYASKSVVYLSIEAGETFLVKARPLIQDAAGVPFAKQSVAGAPDTTHYAYTTTGIYKITEGIPEPIVPQVFDFFKVYTDYPIYLRLVQGRFLFFECLDSRLLSNARFTEESLPEESLVFPGSNLLEDVHAGPLENFNQCTVTKLLTEETFYQEQIDLSTADIPEDQKEGTTPEALYTAYFSSNGIKDLSNLTWDTAPCGYIGPNGEIWDMTPINDAVKTGDMTTDATNKTASAGVDAWIDGKWTMQRFVQFQSAIWKMEEQVLQEFLNEIESRVVAANKIEPGLASCAAAAPIAQTCSLGSYVTDFSDYQFGYNACSFWLTRYALETQPFEAYHNRTESCSGPQEAFSLWQYNGHDWGPPSSGYVYASAQAAADAAAAEYEAIFMDGSRGPYVLSTILVTSPEGAPLEYQVVATVGGGNTCHVARTLTSTTYTKTTVASAGVNGGTKIQGVLGVETAFCLLTHWKYTDVNGVVKTVPATTCSSTVDKYPLTTAIVREPPIAEARPLLLNDDGSFCGEPWVAPDLIDYGVEWPDEIVDYFDVSYLLQDGSIAPKYPTIEGAYVYDLHLKKWGKMVNPYKVLVDISPINSESTSLIAGSSNFGMVAGAFLATGFIYLFDDEPGSSSITYGKIGFYRAGMTDVQEIEVGFTKPCTGSLSVEYSLNGQSIVTSLTQSESFALERVAKIYPQYSSAWCNITVNGKFDISSMKFTVNPRKGRR